MIVERDPSHSPMVVMDRAKGKSEWMHEVGGISSDAVKPK